MQRRRILLIWSTKSSCIFWSLFKFYGNKVKTKKQNTCVYWSSMLTAKKNKKTKSPAHVNCELGEDSGNTSGIRIYCRHHKESPLLWIFSCFGIEQSNERESNLRLQLWQHPYLQSYIFSIVRCVWLRNKVKPKFVFWKRTKLVEYKLGNSTPYKFLESSALNRGRFSFGKCKINVKLKFIYIDS